MDYIYIDTSIFESNNFLESTRINEIFKLSEQGEINIILPAVTYNEVRNRASRGIKDAFEGYSQYRNRTKILRNIPSIQGYFSRIDIVKIEEEFFKEFEERIKKAKCTIVPYPTVNIEEVFDKYFNNTFPFGNKDKKHEFPDAFALVSIEKWCIDNKRKCYVFSHDKDLLNYKSESLRIVESYEVFLDKKLREIEARNHRQKRLQFAKKLYQEKKDELLKEIESWVNTQIDDEKFYYEYVDNADIYDISIKKIDVDMSDYQFTSITNHGVKFETEAEIIFRIELKIEDLESGYYDSEDKEWHARDTTKVRINGNQTIPIQLEVGFPEAGDDYSDIRIYEINNNKRLRI